MEEKESSNVDVETKMDDRKKQLKQFIIVKEYNGSYNMQKKTKREYMQKTMVKEKLTKSERNSLEDMFSERYKDRDKDQEKYQEKDEKTSIKYVTFVDLLPVLSDESDSDTNDNPSNSRYSDMSDVSSEGNCEDDIETSNNGHCESESYYNSEGSSIIDFLQQENVEAKIEPPISDISQNIITPNDSIENVSTTNIVDVQQGVDTQQVEQMVIQPVDVQQLDPHTNMVSPTTMKKIKKGAFYSLLTAGGLLGAYALFKGVSSFENN